MALAVLRTAVWHGLGGLEALGHVDPSGRIVPGAAGVSDPWTSTTAGEAVGLLVPRGVVRGVLLGWGLGAFGLWWYGGGGVGSHGDAPPVPGARLLGDLALLSLAQGVGLVLGACTWAAWSWWVLVAVPTFLLALADAGVLLVCALAWGGRRRRSLRVPPGPRAVARPLTESV